MNLKNLDHNTIRKNTVQLAEGDRRNLVLLLRYLREIERLRLFSKFGFQSLYHYVVDELKYSEDEAQRRISAMRLMRDLPEVAQGLEDGSLKLTNLGMAQTLFKREKKAGRQCSLEQKREIISRVRGKSTRQAAKVMAEINPEMSRTKALDYNSFENDELRDKLLRAKGKFAHIDPDMPLEELLHRLCDLALDPKAPAAPKVDSQAETERRVRIRDGHKCSKCGSIHALELDHIVPVAAGGKSTYENMRLLCRNCNQRAAMDYFGERKMEKYLGDISRPYGVKNSIAHPRPRRMNCHWWDTINTTGLTH